MRTLVNGGHKVYGAIDGFLGLALGHVFELFWESVAQWNAQGGCKLGTNRVVPDRINGGEGVERIAKVCGGAWARACSCCLCVKNCLFALFCFSSLSPLACFFVCLSLSICSHDSLRSLSVRHKKVLEFYKIEALIIVGGFEAFMGISTLAAQRHKFPALCIPMTIIPVTISNNVVGESHAHTHTRVRAQTGACGT